MAFDWTRNRPNGLDLASEGIVVVTVQSRTNVFGWLSLEIPDAPGNIGLYDQNLALKWIQENIQKFGGNPKQVTLLGHGTSGAVNAIIHLISPKATNYFSKLIVMSGTIFSSYSFQVRPRNVESPSTAIVRNLACDSVNALYVLECLRMKSVNDLLKAFEIVYEVSVECRLVSGYFIQEKIFFSRMATTQVYWDPKSIIISNHLSNIFQKIHESL